MGRIEEAEAEFRLSFVDSWLSLMKAPIRLKCEGVKNTTFYWGHLTTGSSSSSSGVVDP